MVTAERVPTERQQILKAREKLRIEEQERPLQNPVQNPAPDVEAAASRSLKRQRTEQQENGGKFECSKCFKDLSHVPLLQRPAAIAQHRGSKNCKQVQTRGEKRCAIYRASLPARMSICVLYVRL